MSRQLVRLGLAVVCGVASGCAEEWGAEQWPTTRVSGQVTQAGEPVKGGWVEFYPIDGTVGVLRSAPIGRDGSFVAENVGVGPHAIGVIDPPLSIPQLRRKFDTFHTPIRRTIPPGSSSTITIDLLDEAVRR